jgi:hypothetical protein
MSPSIDKMVQGIVTARELNAVRTPKPVAVAPSAQPAEASAKLIAQKQ